MDPNATLAFTTERRHYADGRPYLEVALELPQGTLRFTLSRGIYTDEEAALVEEALGWAGPTVTPTVPPDEWYKVQRATPNKRTPLGWTWEDATTWQPRSEMVGVAGGGYLRVVVRDGQEVQWVGPMFYRPKGGWAFDPARDWPSQCTLLEE
jgi:hypothetical protein